MLSLTSFVMGSMITTNSSSSVTVLEGRSLKFWIMLCCWLIPPLLLGRLRRSLHLNIFGEGQYTPNSSGPGAWLSTIASMSYSDGRKPCTFCTFLSCGSHTRAGSQDGCHVSFTNSHARGLRKFTENTVISASSLYLSGNVKSGGF